MFLSRYHLFLPLHQMWMGYMSELLGLQPRPSQPAPTSVAKDMPKSSGMHPKLVKADFHGSIMTGRRRFLFPRHDLIS